MKSFIGESAIVLYQFIVLLNISFTSILIIPGGSYTVMIIIIII